MGGCTRGYGNGFLKLSVVCMVRKLKVLEFFFGFFRTCARSQGSAVRKSCFWQAHATKPRPMAKGQVEGGNALQAARAAEIDAASHRPTAAQKQQQIAELEERAELFGDPVKQSAQANRARAQVAAVFAGAWRGVQVRRACRSDRRAGRALCGVRVLHAGLGECDRLL